MSVAFFEWSAQAESRSLWRATTQKGNMCFSAAASIRPDNEVCSYGGHQIELSRIGGGFTLRIDGVHRRFDVREGEFVLHDNPSIPAQPSLITAARKLIDHWNTEHP